MSRRVGTGPVTDLLDRLGTKFTVGDGCWEWTGARKSNGYGHLKVGAQYRNAHRVLYELLVGPVPDDHDLDHLCRVRHCVRPDHLEPVTRSVNLRRGRQWKRDRTTCPKGHPYDMVEKTGARRCRECRNETARQSYAKRRDAR